MKESAMAYVLTAQQWRRIVGFLPGKASDRGVTAKDNRVFVEAVLWMARNGARWRALPKAYGDWHSVYVRFARWAKAGIWNRLFEALSADADFEYVMVDSTIVHAHQHAAGGKGRRSFRPLAVPTTVRIKIKQNWLPGSSKSLLIGSREVAFQLFGHL
jgi:transposase